MIEFALLAPVFMLLLAGIFENGMIYFQTAQLQSVADNAARQLRLAKISSTMTVGEFKNNYVCSTPPKPGTLGSMFDCSRVAISIKSASDWTGISDISVNVQTIGVAGNLGMNPWKLASVGSNQVGMLIVVYKSWPLFGNLTSVFSKTVTGGLKKSTAAYFPSGKAVFRVE